MVAKKMYQRVIKLSFVFYTTLVALPPLPLPEKKPESPGKAPMETEQNRPGVDKKSTRDTNHGEQWARRAREGSKPSGFRKNTGNILQLWVKAYCR